MSSVGGGVAVNCSLAEGQQVLQLAAQGEVSRSAISGWQRAANVQILPVQLCPQTRQQVASILSASGKINALQSAVASDMLIAASLNRSRYDARDVFAVSRQGGQLQVYVY